MNILDKLVKEEFSKNGMFYLTTLILEKSFLAAVSGFSIEIEAFIRDDPNCNFDRILKVCQLTAFDVWKVLISFARLNIDMPQMLKVHLCYLEMESFFELFWAEKSPLIELIRSQATKSLIDHRRERLLERSRDLANEKENCKPPEAEVANEGQSPVTLSHNVN